MDSQNLASNPPSRIGTQTALLYHTFWGSLKPNRQRKLFLDGHLTKGTANLEEALRSILRFPDFKTCGAGNKSLVDALCTNQNDHEERSQQVKRMQDIERMLQAGHEHCCGMLLHRAHYRDGGDFLSHIFFL